MAQVLCVYSKVNVLKKGRPRRRRKTEASEAVTVISYDEKPGIQAIATTAPGACPPEPGVHPTFTRELNTSATAR